MSMIIQIRNEDREEDDSSIECTDRGAVVLKDNDTELFAFNAPPEGGLWLYIYCPDVHIVHLGDSGDEHETLGLAVFGG